MFNLFIKLKFQPVHSLPLDMATLMPLCLTVLGKMKFRALDKRKYFVIIRDIFC